MMNKTMMNKTMTAVAVMLLFVVAACGGGGGSTPAAGGGGGGGGGLPVVGASEGTVGAPIALSLASIHNGIVAGTSGVSYYTFTTSSTAGTYTIALSSISNNVIVMLRSTSFSGATVTAVTSNITANGPAMNVGVTNLPASTTYYLQISSFDFTTTGQQTYDVDIVAPSAVPTPPPAPNSITVYSSVGQNLIGWSAVSGATSYNLYWSASSGFALGDGGVTKITSVSTPYSHATATAQTYYYKVTAQNANGESIASSQGSAAPVSTSPVAFPFVSNFDGGMAAAGWYATGNWGVHSDAGYNTSAPNCVHDSPAGNFVNGQRTYIMSPVMDLSSSATSTLSYSHRYNIGLNGAVARVEISSNGGSTWQQIKSYTSALMAMTSDEVSITAYKSSTVQIRFTMDSLSSISTTYDGWFLDDIMVTAN